MRWRSSLYFKLAGMWVGSTLALLVAWVSLHTASVRHADLALERRWLSGVLAGLDARIALAVSARDARLMDSLQNLASATGTDLSLIDADGQVLYASGRVPGDLDHPLSRPEVQQAMRGEGEGWHYRALSPGMDTRVSLARTSRTADGRLCVVRAERTVAGRRMLTLLSGPALPVAAGLWLLLNACALFVMWRQLEPLPRLAAAARGLVEERPVVVPIMERQDELGELGRTLAELETRRAFRSHELRGKSELLLAVLQNMQEGVVAVARNETVLLANPASGRMLGFSPADAVGRPLVDLTRHRGVLTAVRQVLDSRQPRHDEWESGYEPRRTFLLHTTILPGPENEGVLLVVHDISELRRLEKLRKEFVANVSHELKTPLSNIKAYAETLRLGALDDPENREEFVRRIEEQTERLHQLITDMLQIARIEAGHEVFHFSDVDLPGLVHECVARFDEVAHQKGIRLRAAGSPAQLMVHVDAEGMRTILDNLLDNALKYTPASGTVEVTWNRQEGYAVVAVHDTGIGIATADQARVFERFYRADKARSRERGGTGLGLSIVKHLAQAFGGDVALDSREGRGSTFRVRIPLAQSPTPQT